MYKQGLIPLRIPVAPQTIVAHQTLNPASLNASLALSCQCTCMQKPLKFLELFVMPPQGHMSRLNPDKCTCIRVDPAFSHTTFPTYSVRGTVSRHVCKQGFHQAKSQAFTVIVEHITLNAIVLVFYYTSYL